MNNLTFYLAVIASFLIIQSESLSQWSSDPNNPMVVCNEPTDQIDPSMIYDGNGGYFIFWTDLRNYGQNQSDLYGQHLDAEGNKLWTHEGKKIADSVFYSVPKAVLTDDGNIIVLYSTESGGGKLLVKKIDPSGNNVWSGSSVYFTAAWPHLGAVIYNGVSDGSGGIIISFQLTWGGGTTFIFAQRVSSSGAVKWSPATNGLNLSVNGESRNPVITSDERGGAHIFWYNVPGPYNIWKTHIDSSGNFSPKTALYLTPNNYPLIRAVSDGAGGAVISWATNGGGVTNSDIFIQRINTSGDIMWNAAGNSVCSVNGAQTNHNLIKTSDGNYIIVWSDGRRININNDVYCQKVNSSGNNLWTDGGVLVTDLPTYYPEPNLISDNTGGAFLFVYNNTTNFSVGRINSDSTFAWSPNLKTLATSIYTPFYQKYIPLKNGDGAAVVWQTAHGVGANGIGIYGAKINFNGTVNVNQLSSEIPSGFSLEQNYPNPFNPKTIISYKLQVKSIAKLNVYDALGKEIMTLVNENQNAGTYSVDFDGSNFSSGIYFYKLETEHFTELKKMILVK